MLRYDLKKNWVIIGGGFLSSILKRYADSKNIQCIVIDKKICDATDSHFANKVLSLITKDSTLIICAAITRLKKNNYESFIQNLSIIHNILNLNQINKGHLIYISSIDVYGKNPPLPITEKNILNPRDFYSLSKINSEYLIKLNLDVNKLDKYTILRLNGIYGECIKNKSVINSMVLSAINESAIYLKGNIDALRDYIWAEDIAKLVDLISEKSVTGVFNVASGRSMSITNIAKYISTKLNAIIKIEDSSINDRSESLIFDTTFFKNNFKNFIFTSVEDGIDKYINFYQKTTK